MPAVDTKPSLWTSFQSESESAARELATQPTHFGSRKLGQLPLTAVFFFADVSSVVVDEQT